MEWQELSGSWVLLPPRPIALIHFLGGAFVGTAPSVTYRWLLNELAQQGYGIIATPFLNTLDHQAIARTVLNRFETIVERLQRQHQLDRGYLPVYGLGHSMGCKLHLLIGSLYEVERAGNILISFNNYPLRQAVPMLEQLSQLEFTKVVDNLRQQFDPKGELNLEFTPSPAQTNSLIADYYAIRRNLLIKFRNDTIDQTLSLQPILRERFTDMVSYCLLSGNHLTPLAQEVQWQTGEVFTPWDAIGQWVKGSLSQDLQTLKREILRWLNPALMF